MKEVIDKEVVKRQKTELAGDNIRFVCYKQHGFEFRAVFRYADSTEQAYTKHDCEKFAKTGSGIAEAAQLALEFWPERPVV